MYETINLIITRLGLWTYLFIFLFAVCIGSFLNVLIYRIPKKEEFVKTTSHCMSCGHNLAWYDNIPLFSWIALRGKCRYCKSKISIQYPLIEFLNGLLWLLIFMTQGITIHALLISLMGSGLLALSIIDWRTYEIENGFHVFFIILGIIQMIIDRNNWKDYLIGFFAVSLILLVIYLGSKGNAIGGGDVKLMAACGLILGWKNILLSLALGCIIGSIIHILRMKISHQGNQLAMGPYLSIGIMIAALAGHQLIELYMSLF